MSPKWTFIFAAWIHYTVLLRFYRDNHWISYLISIPILVIGHTIANVEVIPVGFASVSIFMLVGSFIGLLPYLIDRWTYKYLPAWAKTLVFPTVFTLFSYVMEQGPQGTWGNVAYTQFDFLPLMQIASLVGIYGLSFLIYWSASTVNYFIDLQGEGIRINKSIWAMPFVLAVCLIFGYVQLGRNSEVKSTTKMTTITIDNMGLLQAMYKAEFNKSIELDQSFSQTDPKLVELQKGMFAFMANPDDPKFTSIFDSLDVSLMKYVEATRSAAAEGAKIVTWSEAAIINIKSREIDYQKIASDLAKETGTYLFFPTAVFHPELVNNAPEFIENKVLTFDPEGKLLNTYFKNIPVFGVEPSFPGDGNIPVISTPYGNLSPIICYDADHPQLIDQVGTSGTDLLVVPTGDWKAISPYHTHMAAVRCIENGVSMLKATGHGLSAMIDDKGRLIAQYDYFDDKEVKMLTQDFSIRSSKTAYAVIFPLFIKGLISLTILLVGLSLVSRMKNWSARKQGKSVLANV